MNWEHISTAPKDGSRVDFMDKVWSRENQTYSQYRITDAVWAPGAFTAATWRYSNDGPRLLKTFIPTHWMRVITPKIKL